MTRTIRRARRRLSRPRVRRSPAPLCRVTDEPGESFIERGETIVVHAHKQQFEAYSAPERFTLILAGTRGGKTSIGPWYLLKQMQLRGPGEYLACAPSYPLFKKAAYKEIRKTFVSLLRLGHVIGGASGEFKFTPDGFARLFAGTDWDGEPYDEETKIVFGHAGNPDSLEAAEYKAAWLDEPGQRGFPQESWEAIQRRLAIDEGPAFLTTTPYMAQHWIVSEIYEPWQRRGTKQEEPFDKHCRVVSFESRSNPAFPIAEWDRAQAVLPPWKFDLFYRGILSRPAGLIYYCIDPAVHFVESFTPEPTWKRYVGIDFGAPNFAATFFAEETGYHELEGPARDGHPLYLRTEDGDPVKWNRYFAYAEYRPDVSRTAKEHVAEIRKIEPLPFDYVVGGSMSEGQWRAELKAGGLNVREPDQPEVEIGLDRGYSLFREQRLLIMRSCPRLIEELQNYSRPVDENGIVLEGILDKEMYHSCDSMRYFASWAGRKSNGFYVGVV
jgi:hypothetical protein